MQAAAKDQPSLAQMNCWDCDLDEGTNLGLHAVSPNLERVGCSEPIGAPDSELALVSRPDKL